MAGFPLLTGSAVEKAYTSGHMARSPRICQVSLPQCNYKESQRVTERHRQTPEYLER
jgi:hypothetical protein